MTRIFPLALALATLARGASLDETVKTAFQPHLESGDIAGAAIALVCNGETSFTYLGQSSLESGTPPGPDTVFEIGSITKVMTGTLLALAINANSVSPATRAEELLPHEVRVPDFEGRAITLKDLATHTSGLPRMPGNWRPADPAQPYAEYTAENLFAFLKEYQLPRAPGAQYEYSNMATALLGHALALKAGAPYEALLRNQLLAPLGMNATYIAPAESKRGLEAMGYTAAGRGRGGKTLEPRAMWIFDVFQSAGAVRSNIVDMEKFLQASMSPPGSPLGDAVRLAQQPCYKVNDQLALGLNWHVLSRPGEAPITWHNGQTGGFHAFLGFDPQRKIGIVVLCNTDYDIDPVALQILSSLASK